MVRTKAQNFKTSKMAAVESTALSEATTDENATAVKTQADGEGVNFLRVAFRKCVNHLMKNWKVHNFAAQYKQAYKNDHELFRGVIEGAATSIKKGAEEAFEQEILSRDIPQKLNLLEAAARTNSGKRAWRCIGSPEEDSRPQVVAVKLEMKDQLERQLAEALTKETSRREAITAKRRRLQETQQKIKELIDEANRVKRELNEQDLDLQGVLTIVDQMNE